MTDPLANSTIDPSAEASGVQRRRFLQGMAALGGATMLPGWMQGIAEAAVPIGANDGVIVHIMMEGGNDGLNTLIPITNPEYYNRRGGLAISASEALPLTQHRGLHPALTGLKQRYDQGDVAFIEGVGVSGGNLSHFDSAARVESAQPSAAYGATGWLGRYIDGLPGTDLFSSVSIGSTVPLVAQGASQAATAVPLSMPSAVRQQNADPLHTREFASLRTLSTGSFGRGALADQVGASVGQSLDVASLVENLYAEDEDSNTLAAQLTMVARLINANLGIRVFTVTFGEFDTHAEQDTRHRDALSEFDDGVAAFFSILSEQFAGRTILYAMSEFGRRVGSNGSNGTDHGSAGLALAIGRQVRGGVYGSLPSLTDLDYAGNLQPTVDYRAVYATMLRSWLGADPTQILGTSSADLGFLAAPTTTGGPPPVLAATTETVHRRLYDQIVSLYLAYFGRLPDESGFNHWLGQAKAGLSLNEVSEAFAQSQEFVQTYGPLSNGAFVDLIYGNVLGRTADTDGRAYWGQVLDGGSTRGTVMIGFATSDEFRSSTADTRDTFDRKGPVGRLYLAYFLRSADADGLNHWISTGLPSAVVSQEFSQSAEFVERYGALSNTQFVELIYTNVLDREPDTDGGRYWTARLDSGLSRGEVMLGFSDSPEFISKVSRS